MQVATPGHTYLIDPFAVADLSPLAAVLGAEQPVKVIHNASFEKKALKVRGLALYGVFDTMVESKRIRGRKVQGSHSLVKVCERELGASLDKIQQTSNWSQCLLDSEQRQYAALNADVLLTLHHRFITLQSIGVMRSRGSNLDR